MKFVLLPRALRDIRDIHLFIARTDERAAGSVIERVSNSLRMIEERPYAGHVTEGRPTREWSVAGLPYVIPYRITATRIEVLRVYHTRRSRPADWQ
ncbi:MAG: type II toxin-antitoxin system RelE/ParE family toxin [Aestuariivirga sp.]